MLNVFDFAWIWHNRVNSAFGLKHQVVCGFHLLLIDHREVIHLSTRLLHDNVELLFKFLLSLLHHLLCSLSVVFFKLGRIPRINSDALIAVGAGLPVAI